MSLSEEQIEKIVELTAKRTAELVLKKLTDGFPFSLSQAELIAERVLQKIEQATQIEETARLLAQSLTEEEKEKLRALTERGLKSDGAEVTVAHESCADVPPERPDSAGK